MKSLILILVSILLPIGAAANCISVDGDFVDTSSDEAVMYRFTQVACDSVSVNIMVLQQNTLKPWLAKDAVFKAGAGVKNATWPTNLQYEMLLENDVLKMSLLYKDEDGNDCSSFTETTRDNNYNLVGEITTQCGSNPQVKSQVTLFRLN